MRYILLILFSVIFAFNAEADVTVSYFQHDPRYEYRIQLLKLVLSYPDATEEIVRLESLGMDMTQSRGLMLLEQGKVDVAFLPTSIELERRFLAIKQPIMQGLLGYRVLMIHQDNAAVFQQITSLKQLNLKFTAGFGADWTDRSILESNNIQTESVTEYRNLFAMLNAKRFDYIPRGINEAWLELASNTQKYPQLAVDNNIGLYYPYPIYFFVNKNNRILAERIELGLKKALNDGSFKALFLKYHSELIKRADLPARHFFELENPTLPQSTPRIDTQWWLPRQLEIEKAQD